MGDKLDVKRSAFSLAIVFSILYILCALFFYLMPEPALNLSNDLFHGIDIKKIADTKVPIGSTITGLVEIFFLGLIAGWLFTKVYNWLLKY
ncbi:MAG: DUF5676 family membrane protein [Nanoarchaeota archaeon]|nr:DUF5676 family membrane protein [Nanoarchaeota archaeon]